MILYPFLLKFRDEILALCKEKTDLMAGTLESSEALNKGLPAFFDRFVSYLQSPITNAAKEDLRTDSASHGAELNRLNYSLSHVVHTYGAMCQSIMEVAEKYYPEMSTTEFKELNLCLDVAIASAVSEFEYHSAKTTEAMELQHLGTLVHELRNSLSSATIAHNMIKKGLVGTGGSTSRVLEDNLVRMKILIDRSLSNVRLRADPTVRMEKFMLEPLIEQILLTSKVEAELKGQVVETNVACNIEIESDRHMLLTSLANLVQNAVKYTSKGGTISVRCEHTENDVKIEVKNDCEPMDPRKINDLFKPFVSGSPDKSGLGLGLSIVHKAVSLLHGKVEARHESQGKCVFAITIPKKIASITPPRSTTGIDALQPPPKKRS